MFCRLWITGFVRTVLFLEMCSEGTRCLQVCWREKWNEMITAEPTSSQLPSCLLSYTQLRWILSWPVRLIWRLEAEKFPCLAAYLTNSKTTDFRDIFSFRLENILTPCLLIHIICKWTQWDHELFAWYTVVMSFYNYIICLLSRLSYYYNTTTKKLWTLSKLPDLLKDKN